MTASAATDVLDGQSALHDLDVGVVIQDRDGRIVFANPKATALLGLSVDEITDRTTTDRRWDVIFPDGRVPMAEEHPGPRAFATGEAVRGVLLGVRLPDTAHRVWILVSAVPQRDASGAIHRVVISFSDVSAAHQALRESEATYASVFRSMSEGVVIHAADGTIQTANAAAERVLGLTVDQMMGRAGTDPRWRLLSATGEPLAPGDIPSERALRTGMPAGPTVLRVHRADGEQAWLEVRADPLREMGEDQVSGAVATFTDITEARTTQLALEASRMQVQRVLDAVPGVVYQYHHRRDGTGGLTFVAGRLRDLVGVDEEPHVRRDANQLLERLPAPERAALLESIAHVLVTGGPFEHELSFEHREGGTRWMRIFGVPDRAPDGVYYTGVMLDITAEKQMADALRLRQRREAMGDMAAGIAHNFNNMLAVILPNLQIAREETRGATAELLADAERAAHSAAELVKRMLALGRADPPDAGAHVDLVPIVREAVHICRQTFDRTIAISEAIAVPVALVRGSASELQQVVLNLCLNARDALAGVREPSLRIALDAEGSQTITLTVRDTGAGMNEQTLRRIGEPFFTTKQPGHGTGLGLASAFHTIGEAGGSWTVMSRDGQGTTFVVQFPLVSEPRRPSPKPVVAVSRPMSGTVLIVDDEPMVRTALSRMVERTGLRVVTVDSAGAALERLQAGVAELQAIVLDLSMPGMSGEDALPHLRAIVPTVPVIALSGHVPEDADLRLAAAVLGKPIGQSQLEAVLREVIPG